MSVLATTTSSEVEKGGNVELIEFSRDGKSPLGAHNQQADLTYDDEDEEPALHARTYFALLALFLLNFVQVVALTGPPTVVCERIFHTPADNH